MKSGHPLFFRASASYSKILNVKSIFNTVKNSRATLFFRTSASCSKLLNVKSIFNTVKNSRATLFFRASASCSKIRNVKSIFNTVKIFGATLVFRESASCSKILNDKIYFNAVKIFWATLFFSGHAQVAQKSWMMKNTYSVQWKMLGQTLFFRTSASWSKILNVKNIFHTLKFFRASASCPKILNDKKYFNTVKNFWATLFFSGQGTLHKNPEWWKIRIQYSEKFQVKLSFQGMRKFLKILNVKSIFTTVKIFRATLFFSGKAQVAQKSWTVKKFSIQCNSLGGRSV